MLCTLCLQRVYRLANDCNYLGCYCSRYGYYTHITRILVSTHSSYSGVIGEFRSPPVLVDIAAILLDIHYLGYAIKYDEFQENIGYFSTKIGEM
mgnify:CR=1 FL=1